MNAIEIKSFKVSLRKVFIDRGDLVKYLVLDSWRAKQFENYISANPSAEFLKFVNTQVVNFTKNKSVPQEIEHSIMNIADDFLSGREITIRAGDYIALQKCYSKKK